MPTDQDIAGWFAVVRGELKISDNPAAMDAIINIIETVVRDLHRIADATETLASPPANDASSS